MKTYQIKDLLKNEIMLIELPKNGNTFDDLTFLDSETEGYVILGKPDEIREDDAKELVDRDKSVMFEYKNYNGVKRFLTATESLLSALEREIYWVNPLGKEEPTKSYFLDDKGSFLRHERKQWHEAQEKTFDRNRTIILVQEVN